VSQNDSIAFRLQIEPEPSPLELVAILQALGRKMEDRTLSDQPARSRWAEEARREQLRLLLDELRSGWSR
jgi:hypothetical protein